MSTNNKCNNCYNYTYSVNPTEVRKRYEVCEMLCSRDVNNKPNRVTCIGVITEYSGGDVC